MNAETRHFIVKIRPNRSLRTFNGLNLKSHKISARCTVTIVPTFLKKLPPPDILTWFWTTLVASVWFSGTYYDRKIILKVRRVRDFSVIKRTQEPNGGNQRDHQNQIEMSGIIFFSKILEKIHASCPLNYVLPRTIIL